MVNVFWPSMLNVVALKPRCRSCFSQLWISIPVMVGRIGIVSVLGGFFDRSRILDGVLHFVAAKPLSDERHRRSE